MNTYALLLKLSGLSQREAATFHAVSLDSVKSWCSGRRATPAGAVNEMRGLIAKQERAANEALAKYREMVAAFGAPKTVSLPIPAGDWPCKSAGHMALARVAAAINAAIEIPDQSTHQ